MTAMAMDTLQAPVADEDLRSLATNMAGIIRKLDHSQDDASEVPAQKIFDVLIQTAQAASIGQLHRLKAYDVLCSFIESCFQGNGSIPDKQYVCDELLRLYLDRHDSLKSKHNKRVLAVLIRASSSTVAPKEAAKPVSGLASALLHILFRERNQVRARPAFEALAAILKRGAVPASSLNVGQSCSVIAVQDCDKSKTAQHLLEQTFTWFNRPESALPASHFLKAYIDSLESGDSAIVAQSPPIWADPLIRYAASEQVDFYILRNYALPDLFQRNALHYWRFLDYCGVSALAMTEAHSQPKAAHALVLISLQVGAERGLVELDEGNIAAVTFSGHVVHVTVLLITQYMLSHNTQDARLAGLSLLISSQKPTQPLEARAMQGIKRHLFALAADVDAGFRGQVVSLVQRLVERVRTVTAFLAKSSTGINSNAKSSPLMRDVPGTRPQDRVLWSHIQLLTWVYKFALGNLNPCASYQRHITGSRILEIMVRLGVDARLTQRAKNTITEQPWPFQLNLFTLPLKRTLQDLLLDAFEDVRHMAMSLLAAGYRASGSAATSARLPHARHATLGHSSASLPNEIMPVELFTTIKEKAIQSSRADQSDGLARAQKLLKQACIVKQANDAQDHIGAGGERHGMEQGLTPSVLLQQAVDDLRYALDVASSNLGAAVESQPLHVYLQKLRSCLEPPSCTLLINGTEEHESLPWLYNDIVSLLERCWEAVKSILCSDAPEGLVLDDIEEELTIDTKSVLSWAWRALKEASSVYSEMVSSLKTMHGSVKDDHHSFIKRVGDSTFEQLAQLRHRGAFSTVARTFSVICKTCHSSQLLQTRELINRWYADTMSLIRTKGSSITRRSAGIPAILVALVAPTTTDEHFTRAFNDLRQIALEPAMHNEMSDMDLPQVHAMNSLKSMFTTTALSDRSDLFIVPAMEIAAPCLTSDVWPIRNCALMLLRSLIDRLLGSHEVDDDSNAYTSASSRLAYVRYPGMIPLMHSLLSAPSTGGEHTPRASTEAYFPVLDMLRRAPPPADQRRAFGPLVLDATQSSQWHLRTIAARSFASLSEFDTDMELVLQDLLQILPKDENALHGRLLCVYHICQRRLLLLRQHQRQPASVDRLDAPGPSWTLLTLRSMESLLGLLRSQNRSAVVLASCLDVVNVLAPQLLQPTNGDIESAECYRRIAASVKPSFSGEELDSRLVLGNDLLERAKLRTVLIAHMLGLHQDTRNPEEQTMLDSSVIEMCIQQVEPHIAIQVIKQVDKLLPLSSQHLAFVRTLANLATRPLSPDVINACSDAIVDAAERFDFEEQYAGELIDLLQKLEIPQVADAGSPSQMESSLRINGFIQGARLVREVLHGPGIVTEASSWREAVQVCLDEDQDFALRHAAAISLHGYARVLSSRPSSRLRDTVATDLDLLFVLYDAMNDDDDEIRSISAQVTASLLMVLGVRCPTSSPVPIIAQQMLASYIVKKHATDPLALRQAVERVTGGAGFPAVETQLSSALKYDDALFAVEKPNLYIDPVRESFVWSRVLLNMNPRGLRGCTAAVFTKWVIDGIQILRNQTESTRDGALGWTSEPEVYALGMRVLRGAEVLLAWRSRGIKRLGVRASEVRKALREWADVGYANELHPLWMESIEEVLEKSVKVKLAQVARTMLATGLC